MMQSNFVFATPQELHNLIKDAVAVAVQQFSQPQKISEAPEFLTIEEASCMLNLAKSTIYSMVSKREIPFIKKTKKLYFSKSSLNTWLAEGRNRTKEEIKKYSIKSLSYQGEKNSFKTKSIKK